MNFREKLAQPWTPEFTKQMEDLREILQIWSMTASITPEYPNSFVSFEEYWNGKGIPFRMCFHYPDKYIKENSHKLEILEKMPSYNIEFRKGETEFWSNDGRYFVPQHILQGLVPELDMLLAPPTKEAVFLSPSRDSPDNMHGYFVSALNEARPGFLPENLQKYKYHPITGETILTRL